MSLKKNIIVGCANELFMKEENLKKIAEKIFQTWTTDPQAQIVVPTNPNDFTEDFDARGSNYKNTDESKKVFARCYDPDEWNVDISREFNEIPKSVFIECCTMFLKDFYERIYNE